MHRSPFLLTLAGTSLFTVTLAAPNTFYEDAVYRSYLPARYMLDHFRAQGFQPYQTLDLGDNKTMEFWDFDHDFHTATEKKLLREVIALGPSNPTASGFNSTSTAPHIYTIDTRAFDKDTFFCKAIENYLPAVEFRAATDAFCEGLFKQIPERTGTRYAVQFVDDTFGNQFQVVFKYAWYGTSWALTKFCGVLMEKIIQEGCPSIDNKDGTKSSSGGGVEHTEDGQPAAVASAEVDSG